MEEKIKKLKSEFYEEAIIGLLKSNNGYVTSKMVSELGIHRMYLNSLVKKQIIERVDTGIYLDSKKICDSYYILQLHTPIIYSHMTALYFHNLSIKAPNNKWDITIKKEYHNPKISSHNVFYVPKKNYELGLTEIVTPMGNKVKVYDKERCICDIIRSKARLDLEHIKYSIKEYLKRKDKDLVKLSKYAKALGIEEEVMNYMEFFYE